MKKRLLFDKRGAEERMYNVIIFIVIVVAFVLMLGYFIYRTATGESAVEQVYAKKIALLIDEAKPGTKLVIDVSELYEHADRNEIDRLNTIRIDSEKNEVNVKITEGSAYSYNFFSGSEIEWSLGKKSKKLEVNIG